MEDKKYIQGHLFAMATIFLWGTTFISTKILLREFQPIEILFFRFLLGFLVLIVIYPKRLKTRGWKEEKYFIAAGLCGITLYYLFENIALTYTMASNVGVIISVSPFFTALLARIVTGEKALGKRFFLGFSCHVRDLPDHLRREYSSSSEPQRRSSGSPGSVCLGGLFHAHKKDRKLWPQYHTGDKALFCLGPFVYVAGPALYRFFSGNKTVPGTFKHGEPSISRHWSFRHLFCDMEYGGETAGSSEDNCLYLYGAGGDHHHLCPDTRRSADGKSFSRGVSHHSRSVFICRKEEKKGRL